MPTPPRLAGITALCAVAACGEPGAPLPSDLVIVGKCSFGSASQTHIEPGDVYLYAVLDPGNDTLWVATAVAEVHDDLRVSRAQQPSTELLPARLVPPGNLEFGGLDASRTGPAEFAIAMRDRTGELHVSIGGTYLTHHVYPRCAFWEDSAASP